MTNVLIRNIPDDVHVVITKRAHDAGQSVQQYLLRLVVDHGRTPSLDEFLARVGTRSGGRIHPARAVKDVELDRDRR